ncbi:Glyoxalase/bleomycin resistance protein/dioxygenase [Gluconacetobacter diazotrophicus PA1 5]|uniref:VOC family protein n=1 Tax=Gluconacetobacter diazotrophicus TaxID=33996 RepID=UPI000173DB87|nr:VOC family protein [Gluconacetobacter diazotrophicus]ACI52369.1 Glyoxalase/bleomycin resistance protein/dioxygenase [Gluconacetobacter diazotrophicus PA1 5]TWB05535.1 hypothetical protein FBZ86_11628 [Gluconacetobacter diazotrophicus]
MPRSLRRSCLLPALLTVAVAAPAAHAQSGGFPPLTTPATGSQMPGKIVFTQLVTPNLAAAERFYGAMFGWTFQDVPVRRLHYAVALNGGHIVAALLERPFTNPDQRPIWLPFIATGDVDHLAAQGAALGAHVMFKPRDVPGLGREAVLADPKGAVFAALTSSSGDPADGEDPVGAWSWSALLTSDPQGAATFYGTLFGYQSDAVDSGHFIVSSQGNARGTLNALPPGFPPTAIARWVRFIRLPGVGAAAEQVAALGGHVVVQPHPDRDGVMVALLADPSGAVFGVMEYPGGTPAGDAK